MVELTPEKIALIPVIVGLVATAKELAPASVKGVVTIVVAALAGIVVFNIDLTNPIVAGAAFGLGAVGIITGVTKVGKSG